MTSITANRGVGWGTSLVLHIALLLLFLLTRLDLHPFELTFTRVDFVPLSTIDAEGGAVLPTMEGGKPLVELPRRPMLDETSPLLRLPDRERPVLEAVAPRERPEVAERDLPRPGRQVNIESVTAGRIERPAIEPLPLTDDWLAGEKSEAMSAKVAGDDLFSISWEGTARTKLSGALPQYPPGVQRAATIRLGFEVNPAGEVTVVTPVTKGVAELEKVSIEALRTWRFNPLSRNLPQVNQRGEITFVFRLK